MRISFVLLLAAFSLAAAEADGQARLVLNGAGLVLSNGAKLVIENPAPSAINATSGGIKCTGANDKLIWNTGTTAGTYTVPFLCRSGQPLPVTFTKTGGSGNGSIMLATYATPTWENSLYLPNGVLHANAHNNTDNSVNMADRFWEIKAVGYTQNPELTNVVLAYATADVEAAGNSLTEDFLEPLQWSDTQQNWRGYLGEATVNSNANTVTIPLLDARNTNGYWMLADNSATVLPVHFISFSATANGTQADLNWTTALEENNDYFAVERTRDGQTFEEITRVKGAGTTPHRQAYFTADEKPFSGPSYYRLKQVDLDGKFSYSPLRSVYFGTDEATVSAFPNPATTHQQLEFLNWSNQTVIIRLTDLQGRQLHTEQAKIENEVRKTIQVNFPALSSGTYLLTISGSEKVIQQKLQIRN